jgi:hypothetical protein
VLAAGLGVPAAPYPGHPDPLEPRMASAQPLWDEITARYGLPARRLDGLASRWHTDGDLGRQVETFADMGKSRRLGFRDDQDTAESFSTCSRSSAPFDHPAALGRPTQNGSRASRG